MVDEDSWFWVLGKRGGRVCILGILKVAVAAAAASASPRFAAGLVE